MALIEGGRGNYICEEHSMEFRLLELLRQRHPMLDIIIASTFVLRILKQSRVQMSRRLHKKGIENELLLVRRHDSCLFRMVMDVIVETIFTSEAIQEQRAQPTYLPT